MYRWNYTDAFERARKWHGETLETKTVFHGSTQQRFAETLFTGMIKWRCNIPYDKLEEINAAKFPFSNVLRSEKSSNDSTPTWNSITPQTKLKSRAANIFWMRCLRCRTKKLKEEREERKDVNSLEVYVWTCVFAEEVNRTLYHWTQRKSTESILLSERIVTAWWNPRDRNGNIWSQQTSRSQL